MSQKLVSLITTSLIVYAVAPGWAQQNNVTIDTAVGSSATCAVNSNLTGADLFPVCPGPDTAVECSISLADLGWSSGVVSLLQGCSSTAPQPNSSTFDCIADGGNPLFIDPTTGGNTPVELLSFTIE